MSGTLFHLGPRGKFALGGFNWPIRVTGSEIHESAKYRNSGEHDENIFIGINTCGQGSERPKHPLANVRHANTQ